MKSEALSVTENTFVDIDVGVDHSVGGEAALGRPSGIKLGRIVQRAVTPATAESTPSASTPVTPSSMTSGIDPRA